MGSVDVRPLIRKEVTSSVYNNRHDCYTYCTIYITACVEDKFQLMNINSPYNVLIYTAADRQMFHHVTAVIVMLR